MVQSVQSLDGTTIAYEVHGAGTPLLVIGGALNSRHSAMPLVPFLAEGFQVVLYDRRGRGDSDDTPPYAVEREIEDLAALVDAVGGSALAYGHSSGAILALEAAAAGVPLTKIVVYEPPYTAAAGSDDSWQVFADKVQALADEGHQGDAVEAFIRHTGAGFDEGMKQSPWWPAMTAMAPTLPYDLTITAGGSVPTERFREISAPVLAVYGGASGPWAEEATGAVAMAVRNGRQEVIEGQGHGVAPDAVAPLLIGFLR